MTNLSLEYAGRGGDDAFAPYDYRVLQNGECVAEISHTHRGDEHFLRKPRGEWRSTDQLIEGGGPEPLRLSSQGVKAVETLIAG